MSHTHIVVRQSYLITVLAPLQDAGAWILFVCVRVVCVVCVCVCAMRFAAQR